MALSSPVTGLGRLDIPAVTTTRRVNGAVAMFYPGSERKDRRTLRRQLLRGIYQYS